MINNNVGINGICACRLNVWKIFADQAMLSPRRNSFEYFVDPTMYRRALADEARNQLARTVDRVAGMGGLQFHPDYGAGRLNLLRLLST